MVMRHHVKIYRSFSRDEFDSYFQEIGKKINRSVYEGEGWSIILGEEESASLGAFTFNQIRIELWLREDIENSFLDMMKTRFLRGGG